MRRKKKKNRKSLFSFIFIFIFLILILLCLFPLFTNKEKAGKIEIESENSEKEYINIPNGFYYVGGTINTGIVISDNSEDQNKGTDYETSLNLKGNQYVWIPVENPIAKNEKELSNMVKENKYPMAIQDGKNYRGLLYDYRGAEQAFELYTGDSDNKDDDENKNREPAILSIPVYGDSEEFIKNSTGDLYQTSFNKMIKSVEKYGGFFVSRYEIGNLHTDEITSKANQNDVSNLSWPEGYNKIKSMYNSDSVTSEMIWGCQWDAIMIWLYKSDENKTYFQKQTGEYCNNTYKSIFNTASNEKYSNKNIFDLIGNVSEFTQEAAYSSLRIARGGSYNYDSCVSSPTMAVRERFGIGYNYENVGFRSVLIF